MDNALTTHRKASLTAGTIGAACLLSAPALAAPPGPAGAGTLAQQIVPVQIWWGANAKGTDGTEVDWSGQVQANGVELTLQAADSFDAEDRISVVDRSTLAWSASSTGGKDGVRFDVATSEYAPGTGEISFQIGDIHGDITLQKLGCEAIAFPHPSQPNQMLWISRQCHARTVNPEFELSVSNGRRSTILTLAGATFTDAASAGLSVVRGINTGGRKATFAIRADEVAFAPFAELCVLEGRYGECIPFTDLVCGTRTIPMRGRVIRVTAECPADPGRLGVFFPNPDVYPDPDAYPTPADFADADQFPTPWLYTNPDVYPFSDSLPSPEL